MCISSGTSYDGPQRSTDTSVCTTYDLYVMFTPSDFNLKANTITFERPGCLKSVDSRVAYNTGCQSSNLLAIVGSNDYKPSSLPMNVKLSLFCFFNDAVTRTEHREFIGVRSSGEQLRNLYFKHVCHNFTPRLDVTIWLTWCTLLWALRLDAAAVAAGSNPYVASCSFVCI